MLRLFLALSLLTFSLSAYALQVLGDLGRFGPDENVVLTRVDGDPSRVQVSAYGEAPVVKFLIDTQGAQQCLKGLRHLESDEINPSHNAPKTMICEAQTGTGEMSVFKRKEGMFEVEFTNALKGNIVAITLDKKGLAKAISVFQMASYGS